MSAERKRTLPSVLARAGLVTVTGLALAFGLAMLTPTTSKAEATVLAPEGAAGFQTTDKLLVTISLASPDGKKLQGTLHVELLDGDGRAVREAEQAIDQAEPSARYRFELPPTKVSPDKLALRCSFDKHQFRVPLSKVLVVKAHETSVASSQEFQAGSSASLRCGVHGVKSLSETVPLNGASVDIQLRGPNGKTMPLYTGKTGADGWSRADFKVPSVPTGQYTLLVATRSALGEEKLERAVQIKNSAKIMLVTDKPLYQPGQVMHIRALSLRPFDLRPVAGSELVFEVEDAKGNKVFKRTRATSEFGVASIDFELAEEVNMGDYHVRAILGDQQADKTVSVKRYVLPKFKVNLTADKAYYLPKETIHAEIQTDYFFGKPVSEGQIEVTASTFDVQFKSFQTWKGKADGHGHAKLDIKLPDYFVGQPLQKGNALVRLEAKVTDTADHTETINRTFPVSDQAIRVSLIPEGGRLVPDMENRVFAAAIYPDGTPAACTVSLWKGNTAQGEATATIKTNTAGLAEFRLTPKAAEFRQGPWEQHHREMLGGQANPAWLPKVLYDLTAEARDEKGNTAKSVAAINGELVGENILLRLDKAVYRTGDALKPEIRTSAGLPTTYLDLVRGGQTLLTRWLDVRDGKADYRLDLPAEVFGTVEVHAYQMLPSGEIIRDSRVVYVQPRDDLKIEVKPDKEVFLPGETGRIRFTVTDASGGPVAAALGVIVVDESVYALQEMQPGLEKVYFTLQEELLKPQAQAVYRPSATLDTLVRERELAATQQQIAEVLLTSIKPKTPSRWEVSPAVERRVKLEGQIAQIGWALFSYVQNVQASWLELDQKAKHWQFKPGLLQDMVKAGFLHAGVLDGPFGNKLTLEELGRLEKDFTVDKLAMTVTVNHMQQLTWQVANYANVNRARFSQNGAWTFPETLLEEIAAQRRGITRWFKDAWGKPIRLVRRAKKLDNPTGLAQFEFYELVSAGPDGKFGTEDDIRSSDRTQMSATNMVWYSKQARLANRNGAFGRDGTARFMRRGGDMPMLGFAGGMGGGGPPMAPGAMPQAAEATFAKSLGAPVERLAAGGGAPAPTTRVREYFPETMLWQPNLIADDKGIAELPVNFADSITTWRLSASASSRGGALGGVAAPLRVFQDFFVDIDLPVSLTQNDEVAFPVAVYNYLKTPQTVKLDLQAGPWFELTDSGGLSRALKLKPNEVTSVKFRIKARKVGYQPLTVKASGSKMSDAIKRTIEVVPDGQKVEQVVTDRLEGTVTQTMTIPDNALADASKLLVKVYPGIMSQVLEGTEGMLRLPGG
jgi:hypothetical protein